MFNKTIKPASPAKRGEQKSNKTIFKSFCFFVLLFFCFIAVTGCQDVTYDPAQIQQAIKEQQKKAADKSSALLKCQQLCQDSITSRDLTAGPCLSNAIIPDWVCDVAHLPRQAADDLPENQCPAFKEGKANHYVEVDGNCQVIKSY